MQQTVALSQLLKVLRKKHRESQEDIARLLSISRQAYSKYEMGATEPSMSSLNILADHWGISLDELLGRVTQRGSVKIPVIGTIRGGEPLLAVSEHGESIELPQDMVPQGRIFALVVKGDSMTGDRLYEGDLAIIQQDAEIEQDYIYAVAVNGDEATLKRVHFFGGYVALVPSNPEYVPTNHKFEDLHFYGRLVGKYTRY